MFFNISCQWSATGEQERKMTSEHERMLEDKYILDFQRSKQVLARRNALLGNWLAVHMKRNDVAAMTGEVVRLASRASNDDTLCDDLLGDLQRQGESCDRTELRSKMHELILEAAEQLAAEDEAVLH
jgi:hypothetical protein